MKSNIHYAKAPSAVLEARYPPNPSTTVIASPMAIAVQFADSQIQSGVGMAKELKQKPTSGRIFDAPANDRNNPTLPAVNTQAGTVAIAGGLPWQTRQNISGEKQSPVTPNQERPETASAMTSERRKYFSVEPVAEVITATEPVNNKPVLLPLPGQQVYEPVAESKTAMPLPVMVYSSEKPSNTFLSRQTKDIISKIPPEKVKKEPKLQHLELDHERRNPLEDTETMKHSGIGIEMSIKKPRANIFRMLENAYDELMAGNQEKAIALYSNVLAIQPSNTLALFGLATTYHRAGQISMARPIYGKLLAIDPGNVEGLNNFLVLLSDEAPEDAIKELEKLEKTHANFSPVSAQLAVIYQKTGNYQAAAEKMNRAIELSPENLKYRYDMAVILDKAGERENAAVFYKQVLQAIERGEKISVNAEEIQQRLTFILSNKGSGR